MKVENYSDSPKIFKDRFGLTYKLLGRIIDETATYIIYENPRDNQRYIEELKSTSTLLHTIADYEIAYIEDDKLFVQLQNIAIREGIIKPIDMGNPNVKKT